jgi:hypothetical protein
LRHTIDFLNVHSFSNNAKEMNAKLFSFECPSIP